MRISLIIILTFLFISCSEEVATFQEVKDIPKFDIAFNKKKYFAGEDLGIQIKQNSGTLTSCLLVLDNGVNSFTKVCPPKEKTTFKIPNEHTIHSGRYSASLIITDSVVAKKTVFIHPLQSNKSLEIYTGPKTINADGNDNSMVVAIASDTFHNTVKEGTLIKFEENILSKRLKNTLVPINKQIAYLTVNSTEVATTELVGISHLDISSKEQRVDFVAGWPSKLSIEVEDYHPYANNRSFTTVKTIPIFDSNNNKVADGTQVLFNITDNFGKKSIYNSLVIDGIARVHIKNPSEKNKYIVKAYIPNKIESNGITLNYDHDLKEIVINLTEDKITVGPLIGQLGQFISDGTEVKLLVNGTMLKEESYEGYTIFNISELNFKANKSATVIVSGKEKNFALK